MIRFRDKSMLQKLIHTILSIAGFVPEHMTMARVIALGGSVLATAFILPQYLRIEYAIAYFILSTIVYVGFIFFVLPERGFRLKMIQRFGEERAYLYYEGFLAFAFYHNGVGLTFVSQSSAGGGFWGAYPRPLVLGVSLLLLAAGLIIKIWSAYAVGVPIYYWKDMFMGKRISEFVACGPYRYFSNPMYGIGQLQVYGIAIYYNSIYGLIVGGINQALVFLFYFAAEKQFIQRTYLQTGIERNQCAISGESIVPEQTL